MSATAWILRTYGHRHWVAPAIRCVGWLKHGEKGKQPLEAQVTRQAETSITCFWGASLATLATGMSVQLVVLSDEGITQTQYETAVGFEQFLIRSSIVIAIATFEMQQTICQQGDARRSSRAMPLIRMYDKWCIARV